MCPPQIAEHVLTGAFKEQLETFVEFGSVSNGAITITNDGTTMKLINSKSTEQGAQHATFTFVTFESDGGGDINPK